MNISVNTGFQTENFNNTINDFNKAFSKSFSSAVGKTDDGTNFNEIFNAMGQNPIQGGTQYNAFEPLELKTNKVKKVSPVEQIAHEIGSGFSNSIQELNTINKKSETDFETFASGGDISVHDVMISAQKSSLAMQMAIQLRNQVLNAYNELRNIQI